PRRANRVVWRAARVAAAAGAGIEADARDHSRHRVDADADQRDAMKAGDAQLEILIGRVLRFGVLTSTVRLVIGLALALLNPGASALLLQIGILLLIATPAARVVLSVVEYAIAGDRRFVILTSLVLLELIAGAIAALVFHKKL